MAHPPKPNYADNRVDEAMADAPPPDAQGAGVVAAAGAAEQGAAEQGAGAAAPAAEGVAGMGAAPAAAGAVPQLPVDARSDDEDPDAAEEPHAAQFHQALAQVVPRRRSLRLRGRRAEGGEVETI